VTSGGPDRMDEPLTKVLGARTANLLLNGLKLATTGDLLRHYPRRYLELGELTEISSLPMDESVSLVAEVKSVSVRQMATKRAQIMTVVVTDGRAELDLTFFANIYKVKNELTKGTRALFSGKVSAFRNQKQLTQPLYELLKKEEAVDPDEVEEALEKPYPVYPANAKVSSMVIRNSVQVVLDTLGDVPDPIPNKVRLRKGLIDLRSALEQIHRPGDLEQMNKARRRLIWEEAFVLQSVLLWRRTMHHEQVATPYPEVPDGLMAALEARLPFTLTAGQKEVGREIADDLAQPHPMQRLLQGEVGSGKTLVALRAMLTVVDGGGQAALLAPTEVLAAQHHRSITAMLGELAAAGMLGGDSRGTRVALLTGSLSTAARRKAMLEAASGEAGIVIGTHALLQEKVQFADLGLIVVDEQHRFGVEQRDAMRDKGVRTPHLLVMTATPIPRTVAMTVFGDLEVSTLSELPAGRTEIASHVVKARDARWMERTWQRIAEEAAAGHQTYVVCPRIGDKVEDLAKDAKGSKAAKPGSEVEDDGELYLDFDDDSGAGTKRQAAAVLDVLEALRELPALNGLVIEALHGRMPPDERNDVMRRFAAGEVHVLVATTVIEVGVDVPNATVMAVLDADRFGVSQLHQLRGRVGRGRAAGLCLLVTEAVEGPSAERLAAVAATRDGFELAKLDLDQRREGDVLGVRQSGGKSSLKLLRVLRDEKVIADARKHAQALITEDPRVRLYPTLVAAMKSWLDDEQVKFLDRA
jgi:ATP-dependent DNA helicase RecG